MTLPSSEKRVMQHEHPCQAAVFLDVSHSPITLTFYFCILLLTHADTDSLRTPWIPAQTEVTLLHPPFLPGDQAWAGHPVLLHGHGSAVEVPVTHPTGSPQFEEPAKLSNALHTTHLPAQLCLWQMSHANSRQQSDHKPRQAARPPCHCHTGRGHVGSPCTEDVIATPHLCTFTHAGVGTDAKMPWRHMLLLKWVPQMPSCFPPRLLCKLKCLLSAFGVPKGMAGAVVRLTGWIR